MNKNMNDLLEADEEEQGMENEAIAMHGELLAIYETLDDKGNILESLDMLSSLMVKPENFYLTMLGSSVLSKYG